MMKQINPLLIQLALLMVVVCESKKNTLQNQSKVELSNIQLKLLRLLDEQIRNQKSRLTVLEDLQRNVILNELNNLTSWLKLSFSYLHDDYVGHPLYLFGNLNQAVQNVDRLQEIVNSIEETSLSNQIEELISEENLPNHEKLLEYALSIFRLQKFYDIDAQSMMEDYESQSKRLIFNHSEGHHFSWDDCIVLGKLAYQSEMYQISIDWFHMGLRILGISNSSDIVTEPATRLRLNEILDYIAFGAYQTGQLSYAIEVTEQWLKSEPEHERALSNLHYYQEELISGEHFEGTRESLRNSDYMLDLSIDLDQYEPSEDSVVRKLCSKSHVNDAIVISKPCSSKFTVVKDLLLPELRLETLSTDPEIFRIHDIITLKEADILRRLALPKLRRSTVKVEGSSLKSKFRVAQTAWLPPSLHPVLKRLEERLSSILSLNFSNSEDLQVVNYEFGGFYGPHLDSSRPSNDRSDNSLHSYVETEGSDRMATVLIYLNNVKLGGSTVFPKLGLRVEPVERSAVVWFNLMDNGFSDERSLHTGCPIFSGTKWIATKWPRDKSNFRSRSCKRKLSASR